MATIYVLKNEAMPGLVKIGLTDDSVVVRMKQLSAETGVPLPFECHFAAEVDNAVEKERILHQIFADYRVNPKREFFRVDAEKVVLAIRMASYKDVTPGVTPADSPEELSAMEMEKARRSRIKLDAIGIKPGDQLYFSRDENVQVSVVEGNKVRYEDQDMSLSLSAVKQLQKMGYKSSDVSGSEYWMFEGETLDERRIKMESKTFEADDASMT